SSSLQNPIITNASASNTGTYSLVLTTNGCSASATTSVTVTPLPNVSINQSLTVCAGNTINLTSSVGDSYLWSGPNSFSSSFQNPIITNASASNTGTYSLVVTTNGCSASATTSVTVTLLPNISINQPLTVCAGNAINLTSSAGNSYLWSGPNNFSSSLQNPIITNASASNTGTYSLVVTTNGCSASATTSVTVKIINAFASNTGAYTFGQTITLIASGGSAYSWSGPNSFSSNNAIANIPNANLLVAGVYTVLVSDGLCTATATTNVIVSGIDPCTQLMEYSYVKSGLPYQPMFTLNNGMNIPQETSPTSILVRPICNAVIIESVEMNLQGPNTNWNIIQNVEPFALFDNLGQNVFGRTLEPGIYTITVTGYSADNKGGTKTYGPIITTFTIVGNSSSVSSPTFSGNEFCAGSSLAVTFTTSGAFQSGNQFEIQISDKNGDFNQSRIIGGAPNAGTVNCQLPLSLERGEQYRIRVVSSNAVYSNMNPTPIVIHPHIASLESPTDNYQAVSKTQKAVYLIDAKNKLGNTSNVNYQSGGAIILNSGFEISAGAVFTAKIQNPCFTQLLKN
ncbi:immunoglobulin domain-containing protein, partial [Emticicia aquatilis]|uniref:immunoglobulin domain-containing protein n=1 Tax=Emticicia aquatilis TaxID=1537369 RepID=UPI00166E1E56